MYTTFSTIFIIYTSPRNSQQLLMIISSNLPTIDDNEVDLLAFTDLKMPEKYGVPLFQLN